MRAGRAGGGVAGACRTKAAGGTGNRGRGGCRGAKETGGAEFTAAGAVDEVAGEAVRQYEYVDRVGGVCAAPPSPKHGEI